MDSQGKAQSPWTGARGGLRSLLRVEGVALLIASAVFYFARSSEPWWLFFVLFLAPDLTFVAFAAGKRVGALAYNAAHTTIGPLILVLIGLFADMPLLTSLAAIWLAHLGADRAIGYGLRYPASFEHTHLGPVGALKKAAAG